MGDPLIAASAMRRSIESFSFNLYTCRLCSRAFSSTQALGGHQTAHRKEKSERLIRLIRQAELDELKYAADNDMVLSPEPISWAPPATDDQTIKVYDFMPMGDGTSRVPGSGSENKAYDVEKKKKQQKRKFMNLSGCSKVNTEASDADQKKQKKRKYSQKLSECPENKAADADKMEKKRKYSTKLSDCSENKASELEQKKQKSTKSSDCPEHKASNTEKKKKKKKQRYMKLLCECSEINSGSDADEKKRKSNVSGCSNNKVHQKKSQFTKLMPSPELTLATGAAPDMLVQVFSTDSNESGCTEYF
ncbi:hypothetical protein ACLB2K_047916 [Fragaria x ananassa]